MDPSTAGAQPMSNEDGTVWVTFNGEIYHFWKLREELERCGHTFKSNSDTEVALRAYLEWGPACLQRFIGMFAFAVLDLRRDELFLARDPFGMKPLYYAERVDRGKKRHPVPTRATNHKTTRLALFFLCHRRRQDYKTFATSRLGRDFSPL